MDHHHLIGCGVGIALALAVVALSGGSAGALGVLVAVLLCPLVMLGALMWLARPSDPGDHTGNDPLVDHTAVTRR